jgi:uncharacterized RDD family membrane protein YckC
LAFYSPCVKHTKLNTDYKIIAGDSKEYGPVTLEELQAWILDGRVGPETLIWRSDLNEWRAANFFQELQFELGRAPQIHPASLPPVEVPTERLVGFWSRLGAFLLDRIILVILAAPFLTLPPGMKPEMMFNTDDPVVRKAILQFEAVEGIYFLVMTGAWGATLGKLAIGARIVKADGSRLGFKLAIIRVLSAYLSVLLTFFFGYLLIIFRRDRRALHDIFIGTKVVYKKP